MSVQRSGCEGIRRGNQSTLIEIALQFGNLCSIWRSTQGAISLSLAFSLPGGTGMIVNELSGHTVKGEVFVDRLV